jgi:uncharacterized protein (DUF2141 family)
MIKVIFCFIFWGISLPNNTELKITVKNIQKSKGQVVLAVFQNEKTFLIKPIASKILNATNNSLDFIFDLPQGMYAVSVFQDINKNGDLDKGLVGNPIEPYGFSNNFRPLFSAPDFKDCKFKVAENTHISIRLK